MQRFSLYGVHKRDYQESVTIGQTDARTHTQTDAGQSDPYVPLCFAGDTTMAPCEKSYHNKYTCAIWKLYHFLFQVMAKVKVLVHATNAKNRAMALAPRTFIPAC